VNEKFKEHRKFIFGLVAITIVTLFCGYMRYEGTIFVQAVVPIALAYFTAQAVVEWKNKE
jgi:hypothetical protein